MLYIQAIYWPKRHTIYKNIHIFVFWVTLNITLCRMLLSDEVKIHEKKDRDREYMRIEKLH